MSGVTNVNWGKATGLDCLHNTKKGMIGYEKLV